MAAPRAARSRKALSSGRLSGAAKLTNGRKQFGLRKGCHSDVELCSTECDNQVDTVQNGLDHCAALLKNILEKEATDRETVHRQPGKTTTFKFTSKPLLTKGNTSKKKGLKRIITPAPVQKEIVPISNRKVASSTTPSTEKELCSAAQNQMVQSIPVPCSEHSPGAYQKLYEHVQTQMSLITCQPPQKNNEIPAVAACPTSNQGCQNVAALNCQLPTSTSALSLQHSANSLSTQSGVPVDSANERVPEVGAPVVCPVVSAAPAALTQPGAAALPAVTPCAALAASTPAVPALVPAPPATETAPGQEQQMGEAELVRCIQALLQSRGMLNGAEQRGQHCCPAQQDGSWDTEESDPGEEDTEDTLSEEDELNGLDVSPVRDTSCKTSYGKKILKSREESLEETAHKIRTVKYLMAELRALVTDQGDSAVLRLMGELERSVSLLPAVVGSARAQAGVALALQPLRSENARLRRRLRILNQQLREQGSSEMTSGQSCNYELVSLQSLNMMLQSQLKESQKGLDSLQAKNEELLKIIESQKEENKHLAKSIQDKEEELLENKQHYDIHSTKLKIEVEEALGTVKSLQFKLEASEKENKILGITLRQRDAEVKRLRELTRTLQGSMAKLLSDLTGDNVRPKPEKTLSKSLLEDHEKQMQPELFPGSTSVMTYLKTLEMDHILIDTDLQFSNKIGDVEMQNLSYEKFAAEGSKINSAVTEERTAAPRGPPAPPKQDAETGSDSGTLLDDQSKLDETIYIPLSSNACNKQPAVSGRSGVLPQGRGACRRLDYHREPPGSVQHYGREDPTLLDKLNAGYSVKKTVENTLEVTGGKAKPEGDKVQVRARGIAGEAAKDLMDKPDQAQPGTHPRASMPFPTGLSQKTGSETADFSCISFEDFSGRSDWSASSFSTFTSQDEEDFKNSLAALDANIARLQRTLQSNIRKQ
ncbi:coiled-coil domain-containing protein 14 [Prinia subflava]|uniref:coiled-coil domain-containing protein 14 n=1 Tax=Prinia subflava TaxID=208062 RepID=UPI002FE427F7